MLIIFLIYPQKLLFVHFAKWRVSWNLFWWMGWRWKWIIDSRLYKINSL